MAKAVQIDINYLLVIESPSDEETADSYIPETMPCRNGENAISDLRCLLAFDSFGEITGCRDMSNLQSCGTYSVYHLTIICYHCPNAYS